MVIHCFYPPMLEKNRTTVIKFIPITTVHYFYPKVVRFMKLSAPESNKHQNRCGDRGHRPVISLSIVWRCACCSRHSHHCLNWLHCKHLTAPWRLKNPLQGKVLVKHLFCIVKTSKDLRYYHELNLNVVFNHL